MAIYINFCTYILKQAKICKKYNWMISTGSTKHATTVIKVTITKKYACKHNTHSW